MIKQLLNSVIAKYGDLSVSRRSIINLLASDKSLYFAQLRPIIVNYLTACFVFHRYMPFNKIVTIENGAFNENIQQM